jgi:hypothetical protein
VSDAHIHNGGLFQNLNPYFNVVRLQTILESIQRMVPKGTPLVALAYQGAETANLMVAERSAGNAPWELSVGNQDRDRQARSEAATLVSSNHRLAENDARCRIIPNCNMREYDHDQDDLHNVIEDRRRVTAGTLTPLL